MLEQGRNGGPGPPPKTKKSSRGGRGCCFRCICFCYCCLFLLVLVLAALALYFYAVYQPRAPAYGVQGLEVKAFDVQPDFSLNAEFLVTVGADNPNGNIGFLYGESSSVEVFFEGSRLCSGRLPHFLQEPNNVTLMRIDLAGRSEFGSGLREAYKESRNNKKIPLLVKVKAPVRVVVGELPLREFTVLVNCYLVVDNLDPNKKINIISSNTTFDFNL